MSSAPWCLLAGVGAFCKTDVICDVYQSTVNADADAIIDNIADEGADVVSFCCYIWNIEKTLYLCRKIKERTGCITVLGGPEVAYRGGSVLKEYPFVDYVLAGEGEFCFPQFLDMLGGRVEKKDVCGLNYRENGEVLSNPEGVYGDTPPSPVTEEYLQALDGRICYIESSRGCPYRCAFCLSGRVSPLRFFDTAQVKKDMLLLANSGTRTVKFVDRTFNASARHANEILQFIYDNYGGEIPAGVTFHFEIAGDILKESTLDILEKMPRGAVQLEIGMQSFNENTLLLINRKTDTAKLKENIRRLVGFDNMHIHIDLIAGLKGEGIESFEKSFDTAYSLGAHMLQLGFLKLLYGAPMRESPDEFPCEFSPDPPYEVISTPWLSENELAVLRKCEDALDRTYNSGRFLLTLDYLINTVGITPFSLFCGIGGAVTGAGMSLGEYSATLFKYLKSLTDEELLRERMTCDLLCSVDALQIPESIKLVNKLHKRVRAHFGPDYRVAVLEKSGKIFAVNKKSQKDLFGRYEYKYYDLTDVVQ